MLSETDDRGLPEATGMRPVRTLRLAVVKTDARWEILVNGRRVGGFRLEADAHRCVLDIAGQTRCDGYPVQVQVQDDAGELRSFDPARARRRS